MQHVSPHHTSRTTAQKKKAGGCPPKQTNPETHFQQLGLTFQQQQHKHSIGKDSQFHIEESQSFLICSVCSCIVSCPVETPCHHLFCVDCLYSLFSRVSVNCPVCNVSVHFSQTTPPAQYVNTLLKNLHVKCKQCNTNIHYTNTSSHICHPLDPLHDHTYAEQLPDLAPHVISKVATHYLRGELAKSNDGMTASFGVPGRGQVRFFFIQ